MGLPHLTLDLRSRFRAEVVEDFLTEHAAGRTPNPCVRNGTVRFEEMLALAGRLGAARLATGHYARVEADSEGPLISFADDSAKDQSYMLARLAPEQLARLWFPLGGMRKPAVRELARSRELPVADRRESQDLCFLSGIGKQAFLGRHAPAAASGEGEIVNPGGEVIGRHGGHERFTVGQRRGIGVGAARPLYVLGTDPVANRVVVGDRSKLATTRIELRDAALHRASGRVDAVKLRYRSEPVACRVEQTAGRGAHARLGLTLETPAHGIAPGQTACLLEGRRVVGVGTIAARGRETAHVA